MVYYVLGMVAANQNQKFPFHFLSAPPAPPAENLRKEGKFLVLYRDRRERTRRASFVLKIGSNLVQ